MAGSVLMLVAILALYFINAKATGKATFDVIELYKLGLPAGTQYWLFGAFALRLQSRCPCFPSTPGCRMPMRRRPRPEA